MDLDWNIVNSLIVRSRRDTRRFVCVAFESYTAPPHGVRAFNEPALLWRKLRRG
jgi:hypothetical protein